jgi:hypothetical protein
MPTLIVEELDIERWSDEFDRELYGLGSDDRSFRRNSKPVSSEWFLDEAELRAYQNALVSLLSD